MRFDLNKYMREFEMDIHVQIRSRFVLPCKALIFPANIETTTAC